MTPRFAAPRRMRGASLVTAIFLLVIFSLLGVAMVTLATSQQKTSALDVLGSRVYLAARSGAEWGVYRALRAGSCVAATSLAPPAGSSLSGFNVTVNCSATVDSGVTRYVVTATACNQAGACGNAANSADYVQRVVAVDF
jgi:MSHA biogenesis protein MshP